MRNAQPNILAIDPGCKHSAWIVYDAKQERPLRHGIDANPKLLKELRRWPDYPAPTLMIEWIESYGMAVGREVFETIYWSGRFIESWSKQGGTFCRVSRRIIKLHLCNSARANDSNVRQALIDRWGGSREEAIGRKASPGPLYGMKTHLWAALGVAVTGAEYPIDYER